MKKRIIKKESSLTFGKVEKHLRSKFGTTNWPSGHLDTAKEVYDYVKKQLKSLEIKAQKENPMKISAKLIKNLKEFYDGAQDKYEKAVKSEKYMDVSDREKIVYWDGQRKAYKLMYNMIKSENA